MATITGLTKERMQEIIDSTIVDADVVGDNLILTKSDATTINAGNVRGAVGPTGPGVTTKGAAFPGAPTDGDIHVRTDFPGDPMFKFTDGIWTVLPALGFPSWYDDFAADRRGDYLNNTNNWADSWRAQYSVVAGQLAIDPAATGGPRTLLISASMQNPRVDVTLAYAGEWGAGAPLWIPLLWLSRDNCIICTQDAVSMIIKMRKNGVESTLASSPVVMANGGSAYYRAMIIGDTIRFMRWNTDPDVLPPAGPNFETSVAVPVEFKGRSGLAGIGCYVDASGGAGSRATKFDNLRIGRV